MEYSEQELLSRLPLQPTPTTSFKIARFFVVPILKTLFKFQLDGLDNTLQGSHIVICNHLNWLDSFTILLAYPKNIRVHFLANAEGMVKHKFQFWVLRKVGGYIPIVTTEHHNSSLYNIVDKAIELGCVIAIFPEGHYGNDEKKLSEFHSGFAHFAINNKIPVVPSALIGTKNLWFRKRIKYTVGKPLQTSGVQVKELVDISKKSIQNLLDSNEVSMKPGIHICKKLLTNLL